MMSISVIIPVYNCERFVAEAIRSVQAQVSVPAESIEIIAIDDGSTERSAEGLREFGDNLRHSHQPKGRIASARNCGIAMATGELLAFLDADDRWTPEKLALQVAALEADPNLDAVFGHVRQFYSETLPEEQRPRLAAEVMPGHLASAMLVRRSRFDAVGGFDDRLRGAEFIDWLTQARERGLKMAMLPEVVLERRIHDSNTGRRERERVASDYLRVVRAALQRRREGQEATS